MPGVESPAAFGEGLRTPKKLAIRDWWARQDSNVLGIVEESG
jgi:hypothetical protein